jgi:hypothetical protein
MSCRDGFTWNGKRHSRFDNLSPNVEGAGYAFELKVPIPGIFNLSTYFPNICKPVWIGRKDNLDIQPKMVLQAGYFSDKTQLPKPKPDPRIGYPIDASLHSDTYASLCDKGRHPGLIDSGGLNTINPCEVQQQGLIINALQQIFDEVCGCRTKKFPFKACPGVAYYVRWRYRLDWHGGVNYDPQYEGSVFPPPPGWDGAQLINEGTDDAYITDQYPMYAPIEVKGYYNGGPSGFPQECREIRLGYIIQYSKSPIIDTQDITGPGSAAKVNFGVGQYGGEDGIICGWKVDKIQFLRYRENIPGVRIFDIDEPDPLCPQFVPYPTPMPCQPLIIIIPCEEPKPEPEPDKLEPCPPGDEFPICKNGIKATFICPEDELPPKPCPEVKPCDPCDKPEPCPTPKPCDPCDKPEPCPPGKPGSPPGIPGGPDSPPDKPEPCPLDKPCPPPDKPEPQRCADGSSPICPEDDMKDCCDFSLIITEIQNAKLDLRLEIRDSREDIINKVKKVDDKVEKVDDKLSEQFNGSGTVTICDDDGKDFTYKGKGLKGITEGVNKLIELTSYGITELSNKVCDTSASDGCATCYLSIKPSAIFNSNGDFQPSSLVIDVPDKQPQQCAPILSFARSSLGSIWTRFNEAVQYYVESFPQLAGEIKSDIERIGLTKNDAVYIDKGLQASGGTMEAFTAVTVLSSIAQNTLSRLMIQPNSPKDGQIEIQVPDLFGEEGDLVANSKITVTNLSGVGYEDAAKAAEADLNKQWANFTATIAKGLEDLTPPVLADASNPYPIVPKPKPDIEKFGLPITIIRYLNQALKFSGKGLLIEIAKTILENIIQDTLTRLLKGSDAELIAFPVFHGEQNESIKVGTQLVLSFAVKEPKDSKEALSRWHLSIPNPVPCETLDWCKHFEPMERKIGNIMARVYWAEFTSNTYAYFETRDHAIEFMTKLILPLSSSKPIDGNDGGPVRVTDNGSPKRKPRHRTIKCVEAIYVTIDSATGEPEKIACLKPPAQGCK